MTYLFLFIAGYASVFLLGFQSRNVNYGNYGWAAATSFGVAMSQTVLWGTLLKNLTWEAAVVYGLSGALGIITSMYVHHRWVRKRHLP